MKKVLIAFVSLAVVAIAFSFSSTSSATQFSGANGPVTYSILNQQTSTRALYSVNPDGTGSATVISNSSGWSRAVFSPDNSKIAQVVNSPSNSLIIQNPDLTGAVTVATMPSGTIITDTFFNRDSTGIYYVMVGPNPAEIHFVALDGTGDTIVSTFAAGQSPISVNISPDGANFVASISNSGNSTVFLRPVAGGADTVVTTLTGATASSMSFSPDGTKLLFTQNPSMSQSDLVTINIDGTGATTIVSAANEQHYGIWSPDGTKIAYIHRPSVNSQNNEIVVANSNGSSPVVIVGPGSAGEVFAGINWRLNGGPTPIGPTTTTTTPASDPVVPTFTG